ncbi:hypothetical protein NM208_g14662 [Fusarium decemcellulare]|uniref:Uncharacterized protein n=1 Tax=Fusarium decemcellulare TaxID=57161 RepID=A0ACC1RFA8_9HYPO|nr:hypothetical protein NM208_g14662 [Fusarium decemcellulare]
MLTVACHTPGDEKPRTAPAKTLKHLLEFCFVHPCSKGVTSQKIPEINQFQPALKIFVYGLCLSGGDGLAETSAALSRAEVLLALGNGIGLLDDLLTLGQDELDVAGVGHVGVNLS